MTKELKQKFKLKSTLRATYRRGGLVFPSGATLTKALEDLSAEQWEALDGDPRIIIEPVAAKKTAAKKTAAKKVTTKKVAPKTPVRRQPVKQNAAKINAADQTPADQKNADKDKD